MRKVLFIALILLFWASFLSVAFADEKLVGTWEWDESYRDEEGG